MEANVTIKLSVADFDALRDGLNEGLQSLSKQAKDTSLSLYDQDRIKRRAAQVTFCLR
jgi:hypothetical protein